MKHRLQVLSLLFVMTLSALGNSAFDNPRVGIVISRAGVESQWEVVQMAAHGWGATVNLAGIPYDCLFVEDVAGGKDLSRYQALIFAQCADVADARYPGLVSGLKSYLAQGGSVILDGRLAVNDERSQERDHSALDGLLGLRYPGYFGDKYDRIRVSDNDHYATRSFAPGQFITQHLAEGLNIVAFAEGGQVLLQHGDEQETRPFLSVKESGRSRIALLSDLSTWSGAPSFFRNAQPQVFYANQLFNVLIGTLQWAVYGDPTGPFPVPQVSNANLTAIIRHDGDASRNLEAQVTTMNYITDIARESGVVAVYSWVSSFPEAEHWKTLAPLGKMLEDFGGEISTHSRYHRIDEAMTPARWEDELSGSVKEIEDNMKAQGYDVGRVIHFINPGNTIRMRDYGEVSRRFSFYMTHGFEQDMPLGWGNLTWFAENNPDFVLLENIPSPDYQWFYDPEWSYTTQQITAYEEAIFDHLYQNIGRGAIFNEMWHDYSITTQPQRPKERIVNERNLAFYDAMRAKFATHDIYCPTPDDLGHKLRAMAQWNYGWTSSGNKLEMRLDLSAVHLDEVADFTGGMGIKIENSGDYIQKVTINGVPHRAFHDRVVILPNLAKGPNIIKVELGPLPPQMSHLRFVSKRMPAIRETAGGLEVELLTKSKAKFAFYAAEPCVLLNADWQEWNRQNNRILNGYVTSDRSVLLKLLTKTDFRITRANLPVTSLRESENSITLTLAAGSDDSSELSFQCARKPAKVRWNGREIATAFQRQSHTVSLPDGEGKLEIVFER